MQPEIRKERVEKYGSFLYCPERDNLCFAINTPQGVCERKTCYLDDSEYLKSRAEQEYRMQENHRREMEEKRREKEEPPAPIRRQTKTAADRLEEKIESKEEYARKCYRDNKPKLGDSVMREVMRMQGQLRKMKGA